MNRPPSFQFYPRDWLDFKVQRMSLAAQGAYLKLLCYMWNDSKDQCSVADNNELIARGLGTSVDTWIRLRREIQDDTDPILATENGCLVSRRLKAEATKQRKYRKLQALKGTQSAQRRSNRGSTAVQPEPQPDANSSSTSSSTTTEKTKSPPRGGRSDPAFDYFAEQFERLRGVKYAYTTGDFVQLANLRKRLDIESTADPAGWHESVANFLGSPLGKYTLADLCSRFDVFRKSALNEYGKPRSENRASQVGLNLAPAAPKTPEQEAELEESRRRDREQRELRDAEEESRISAKSNPTSNELRWLEARRRSKQSA